MPLARQACDDAAMLAVDVSAVSKRYGRGGNAVMLVRGEDGKWSPPAFYTIGGISWGLQFGGQTSELVLAVMTDKGVNAVMNRQVTLGADAGVGFGGLGFGGFAFLAAALTDSRPCSTSLISSGSP